MKMNNTISRIAFNREGSGGEREAPARSSDVAVKGVTQRAT